MPVNIWDFWASRYERLWSQKYVLRPSRALVLKHLGRTFSGNGRILDLGCGIGQLAAAMADRFPGSSVTGVDASGQMIARARREFMRTNLDYRESCAEAPGYDGKYDVIVCTHAFPYFSDQEGVLCRLHACMNPGGVLMVLNANCNVLYDRLWLLLVRLTTSRSRYPSVTVLKRMMADAGFRGGIHERIRTAAFVPSVYLVTAVKP